MGSERLAAIVIGTGFCGLAAGASLRANGVSEFALLEQGSAVGHFWSTTYDRFHLHSAWHGLPNDGGLNDRYPMYKSRDQLLDYLRRYAMRHLLTPHLRFGVRVERIARDAARGQWLLQTDHGPLEAEVVAVATGANRLPDWPKLSGAGSYQGVLLHSSAYRNAAPFVGKRVLVVGSGNSAAEIAVDLVEGHASDVAMLVRGPRAFIPKWRSTLLFWLFRRLGAFSEAKIAANHAITLGTPAFDAICAQRDKLGPLLTKDMSRHGIAREPSVYTRQLKENRIPVFDRGTIRAIRRGAIRVIDGNARRLEGLTRDGARLGGTEEPFDAVVLATGFRPGLEELFEEADALLAPQRGGRLLPRTDGRCRSSVYPSLFFPGFVPTVNGGLSLGHWGWEAGEAMARVLASRP
jgi:indole-3-pyruvate monooxygenase